jgi:hypothetical protein
MAKAPDQQLFDLLSADRSVAELALALREMLLEEAPEAQEKAFRNHPSAVWFGFGPKMADMFCYIAAASQHVKLGFCRGASLPDPKRLLEGQGRTMRHIKLRSEADLERPSVR